MHYVLDIVDQTPIVSKFSGGKIIKKKRKKYWFGPEQAYSW